MVDFLLCVAQYIIIAIFLCGVGALGAFLGIKKRNASDAKKAAESAGATEEQKSRGSLT